MRRLPKTDSVKPLSTLSHILENDYRLERPQVELSTLRKMRAFVKRWESIMGNCPVYEIDRSKLLQFRKSLLDAGFSPATINGYIRTINTLANIAGHTIDTRRLKLTESGEPKATPTIHELDLIWRLTGSTSWPATRKKNGRAIWLGIPPANWWRALLMLTFSTGLRSSDVFGLEWKNIKPDRIPTLNRKTKKFQYLPIPEPLRPWLEVLKKQNSETLFTTCGRTQQINRELRRLAELAGTGSIGMQALRRASAMAYERAHPGSGRLILNHGKDVTTEFYLPTFEILREASRKLEYPPSFLDDPETEYGEQTELESLTPDPTASSAPNTLPHLTHPATATIVRDSIRPNFSPNQTTSKFAPATADHCPWDFL